MEIVSSAWHVVSACIVLFFGASVALTTATRLGVGQFRALILYAWHTIFSFFSLWYVMNYGGDAVGYYRSAQAFSWDFDVGTQAVNILTGLIVNGLGLSILGAFLAFNIFGVIGLLAFDASLRFATLGKPSYLQKIATIIVFLPSVSFWSAAIGKDSLSFMATGLALWAILSMNTRWKLLAFAILIMLLVRPHVASIMLLASSFAILTSRQTRFGLRLSLLFLVIAVSVTMVPFALQYVGFGDSLSFDEISDYVDQRQGYNMEGGGGIDLASMSLPMQLFSYMFRPMIFEATTIFAVSAAIDNLILVFLFVLGVLSILRGRKSSVTESRAFIWVYVSVSWFVLATSTSNLGIALRQKWMFAPMFILFMISVIGANKRKRLGSDSFVTCDLTAGVNAFTGISR